MKASFPWAPGLLACALVVGPSVRAADALVSPQRVEGTHFSATLQRDGSVCVDLQTTVRAGSPCKAVDRLQEIVQIVALGPHPIARQADGRVWAWQPLNLPRPRPIEGLPGKVTDMGLGAEGGLWLAVSKTVPGAAGARVRAEDAAVRMESVARPGLITLALAPEAQRATLAQASERANAQAAGGHLP